MLLANRMVTTLAWSKNTRCSVEHYYNESHEALSSDIRIKNEIPTL